MSEYPSLKDFGITGSLDYRREVSHVQNPQIDPEMPPTQEELVKALDQLLFERVARNRADEYNKAVDEILYNRSPR